MNIIPVTDGEKQGLHAAPQLRRQLRSFVQVNDECSIRPWWLGASRRVAKSNANSADWGDCGVSCVCFLQMWRMISRACHERPEIDL